MKKVLSLFAALCVVLSLSACTAVQSGETATQETTQEKSYISQLKDCYDDVINFSDSLRTVDGRITESSSNAVQQGDYISNFDYYFSREVEAQQEYYDTDFSSDIAALDEQKDKISSSLSDLSNPPSEYSEIYSEIEKLYEVECDFYDTLSGFYPTSDKTELTEYYYQLTDNLNAVSDQMNVISDYCENDNPFADAE